VPKEALVSETLRFTADNLEFHELIFREFRKIGTTKVAKIGVPFEVETSEGLMRCESGWLAIDSEGNPYPIADDVFEKTYEEIRADS
jgi:hypothetical protein